FKAFETCSVGGVSALSPNRHPRVFIYHSHLNQSKPLLQVFSEKLMLSDNFMRCLTIQKRLREESTPKCFTFFYSHSNILYNEQFVLQKEYYI
ncbi:hypothetical protein, partial [Domibacillus tundrae]|uniref:hypothetical protein n=1 Tax=Domibacillus tundrae TaxID=1587527 RepID=UPI003396EA36